MTATDNAGNVTTVTRSYTVIPATNTNGGVSGTVPATLALTLGTPATFGAFTPGVDEGLHGVHDGQRGLHRR